MSGSPVCGLSVSSSHRLSVSAAQLGTCCAAAGTRRGGRVLASFPLTSPTQRMLYAHACRWPCWNDSMLPASGRRHVPRRPFELSSRFSPTRPRPGLLTVIAPASTLTMSRPSLRNAGYILVLARAVPDLAPRG